MELFYQLRSFLLRVVLCASVTWLISTRTGIGDNSTASTLLSLGFGFTVITTYNLLIYPKFIDPLRKLPTAYVSDPTELFPVTNAPRGENAARWVRQFPGADMINLQMGMGNRVLFPVSPQAHRDILNAPASDYQKPQSGINYLGGILGHGLVLSEGDVHRRQRRIINPSFRVQNIRSLLPLIAEKTDAMLAGIQAEMQQQKKKKTADNGKGRGASVDIASWGSRLTMDIIGPPLMSKDFGALRLDASALALETAFAEIVAPSTAQAVLLMLSMLLPQWVVRNIPIATNAMLARNTGLVRKTCSDILDEKTRAFRGTDLKADDVTADILGSIMARGEFSYDELVDQMITFLSAGHETTASAIAWVTHLLTLPEYKHYQEMIRKEVREAIAEEESSSSSSEPSSVVGGGKKEEEEEGSPILSYERLESLPMVNGVCQEALRIFPPVTTTNRKAIRDTVVAGVVVPKETIVMFSPWAINRNPEFWGPDAERMVPERWIDELPDGSRRPNKNGGAASNMCDQTFLHGNRACIGRDFSKVELRYVVAALFGRYRVSRLPGDDGKVTPAGALTIKPAGGLHVAVEPY